MINVEVAYATPEKQTLLAVSLFENCTVAEAIVQSGILKQFSELHLEFLNVGIFSTPCALERNVKNGDRIEIYRPLQNDPKDARRQRAMKR
ncbi:MAG: RnfH family protein [Methylococcales bacterium]|nr:RnfH family protein [Methylococcales bacterium]MDD5753844.1 RnfH family protein [Methylococcales bacterium]